MEKEGFSKAKDVLYRLGPYIVLGLTATLLYAVSVDQYKKDIKNTVSASDVQLEARDITPKEGLEAIITIDGRPYSIYQSSTGPKLKEYSAEKPKTPFTDDLFE